MSEIYKITTVTTKPFEGQKPGTSGLRKKTGVFQQKDYTENFVQCVLDGGLGSKKRGATLVVGGDGRYLCPEVTNIIIKMSAANGISKLIVGQNGFLSTPAVSCIIRKKELGASLDGGIILTASHNPGGPSGDFGIKFNCENGGPAPDQVTDAIYKLTTQIDKYYICQDMKVDFTQPGLYTFQIEQHGPFTVKVVNSVEDYVALMEDIFDFAEIKKLFGGQATGKPFRVLIDSMYGATGPYVSAILGERLGATKDQLLNTSPKPDFGGGHPDPNLTYAHALVTQMEKGEHDLGAAFDGDGDRNMILGSRAFFVTPGDSLAVIAANLDCIPYFRKHGVKGYARSMPTAAAVDKVAAVTGKPVYEVPTGWKYFGNLMDAGRLSLCGEESFGTGSDHIREKDGIWACLAWLQILAHKKQSVEEIVTEHWKKYGRNVFTRYDYENVDAAGANLMMNYIQQLMPSFVGQKLTANNVDFVVKKADNFEYTDPVDGSVSKNQGIRVIFEDGSRFVVRLSGTGSAGATVRLYADSYITPEDKMLTQPSADLLRPLLIVAVETLKLEHFTSRKEPTVIT